MSRFRHEDIASVPAGWKVRTVTTPQRHRVRIAFPPGRKQKGSGRVVSILHPLAGENPCTNGCTLRSANPAELMVMGANPPRRRINPAQLYDEIKPGSKVTIVNRFGQKRTGRAVMRGPYGWVLNMGGPHGTPAIASPENVTKVRSNPGYFQEEIKDGSRVAVISANDSSGPYHVRLYLNHGETPGQAKGSSTTLEGARKVAYRILGIRHNPAELLVMGANPRVEVVHAANPPVEDIVEGFTGKEAEWLDVYNEPHIARGRYAQLGPLLALHIKPFKGGQVQRITFGDGDDAPLIVTDSTARQIYFVGGTQDISGSLESFGARDRGNGTYELGQSRRIDYQCRKEHVAHPDEDLWKHEHGEEDGVLPTVLFDAQHKKLLYEGGNYRIDGPWIHN